MHNSTKIEWKMPTYNNKPSKPQNDRQLANTLVTFSHSEFKRKESYINQCVWKDVNLNVFFLAQEPMLTDSFVLLLQKIVLEKI